VPLRLAIPTGIWLIGMAGLEEIQSKILFEKANSVGRITQNVILDANLPTVRKLIHNS
jgi:hypothetical protein